jgi:hypothetical protein
MLSFAVVMQGDVDLHASGVGALSFLCKIPLKGSYSPLDPLYRTLAEPWLDTHAVRSH